MHNIPAHKQCDTNKAPGQVVNPTPERYLHQYIERKTENRGELGGDAPSPKLTFGEWWTKGRYSLMGYNDVWAEIVWKAAQENK